MDDKNFLLNIIFDLPTRFDKIIKDMKLWNFFKFIIHILKMT